MVFRITLLEVLHSYFAALGQEHAVPLHLRTVVELFDNILSETPWFRDVEVLDTVEDKRWTMNRTAIDLRCYSGNPVAVPSSQAPYDYRNVSQ